MYPNGHAPNPSFTTMSPRRFQPWTSNFDVEQERQMDSNSAQSLSKQRSNTFPGTGIAQKEPWNLNRVNDAMGSASSPTGSDQAGNEQAASQKRKEQNRASQRAYRERKSRHTKDLQEQVEHCEQEIKRLRQENQDMSDDIDRVESENLDLRARVIGPRRRHRSVDESQLVFSRPVLVKDLLTLRDLCERQSFEDWQANLDRDRRLETPKSAHSNGEDDTESNHGSRESDIGDCSDNEEEDV